MLSLNYKVCKEIQNYFSHFWLATVQEVLQADWHEAWHSPQPPFAADFLRFALFNVLMCFIAITPLNFIDIF